MKRSRKGKAEIDNPGLVNSALKKLLKFVVFSALCIFIGTNASALEPNIQTSAPGTGEQQKTISGTVKSTHGELLPGVTDSRHLRKLRLNPTPIG